jgi:hypothetical protein
MSDVSNYTSLIANDCYREVSQAIKKLKSKL